MCHGQQGLVALERDVLLSSTSATVPGLALVRPWDPARSMLVRKVVPHVDDRFGTVMPPPWSELPLLSRDEQRLVEQWVGAGAAR